MMERRRLTRLPNRGDGRHPKTGRFMPGCRPGPGNPLGNQVAAFRQACLSAVTPEELAEVMRNLLRLSLRDDNVAAARVLLERLLGRIPDASDVDRIADDFSFSADDRFL